MKRLVSLVSVVILALVALMFLTNLFSSVPVEAAAVPDGPEAVNAPPVITSLNPPYGYNDFPTTLSINGLNFVTNTAVYLDATQLTNMSFISSTSLTATVPPGLLPGSYDVRVVNPNETPAVWVDAFAVLTPTLPTITAVSPDKGPNNVPVTIDIYGSNFPEGSFAMLTPGFIPLEGLIYINSSHLRAVVPKDIVTGVYTLEVSTPNEASVTLPNAYEAIDPAVGTDLYAGEYDLWRQPLTIRLGDTITPVIGLMVHRQGGVITVSVPVDFYLNGPSDAVGGTLIGQRTAFQLAPNDQRSTLPLSWMPAHIGPTTIYAVIDPANQIPETDETNNVISRTVNVLPPLLSDTTPPNVTGFRINNGAVSTKLRHVILDTTASDNIGGSGVESILFAEFAFVQSAGTWQPVKVSGWLPFAEASVNQPAALVPSPGIHYVKVWVADKAGNISAPRMAAINYRPDSIYIGDGEIHVYRRVLQAGENWQVQLTMQFGGVADLYVWDPAGGLVEVQETGAPVQTINVPAGQTGVYQVEVEGRPGGYYNLAITQLPAAGGALPTDLDGPSVITGRAQPFLLPDDEPGDDVGLPDAPVAYETTMLPVVIKN